MTRECTEESFLKDVARHEMTVLMDKDVHRHLRFKKPGTGDMYFDIVTWPNFLCYSGDMGCYVFSRVHDMFGFFRTRPEWEPRGSLHINLSYWAEKLEATDKPDGHQEYNADLFRQRVTEILDDIQADQGLRNEVQEYVLDYADDGEVRARDALDQFEHSGRRIFTDTWEWDLTEYTFRFVWCCYALAWAIRTYDAARAAPETSPALPHLDTCGLKNGGSRCTCGLETSADVCMAKVRQHFKRDVPDETLDRSKPAVPPGHFWRGVLDRNYCRNCGHHYDQHQHTDDASTCPTANRGTGYT